MAGNNARYFAFIAQGLCGVCGKNPLAPGSASLCVVHRDESRARAVAAYQRKIALGECLYSGCHKLPKKDRRYCAAHDRKRNKSRAAQYKENAAAGLCLYAKKHGPALPGGKVCQACSDKYTAISRAKYYRRRKAGLCRCCDSPPLKGKMFCAKHAAAIPAARLRLQQAALEAYGGPRCTRCGCSDPAVLRLDYADGHGRQHRKKIGAVGYYQFCQWLKNNGYPQQPVLHVLCQTCIAAVNALTKEKS